MMEPHSETDTSSEHEEERYDEHRYGQRLHYFLLAASQARI